MNGRRALLDIQTIDLLKATYANAKFPAHPFSLIELYPIAPVSFAASGRLTMQLVVQALPGFELTTHNMPDLDRKQGLHISDREPQAKQTVAVARLDTKDESYTAAIMGHPIWTASTATNASIA